MQRAKRSTRYGGAHGVLLAVLSGTPPVDRGEGPAEPETPLSPALSPAGRGEGDQIGFTSSERVMRAGAVFVGYEQEHLDDLCRRLGLRLVVLFGSRATGSPSPGGESDLDLAVLGGRVGVDFWDAYQELAEVFRGVELDLVLLHQADPLLRYEVMRRGKLLYGDPDEFLEYRAFAFRDFVDSADLRRLEQNLFEKKMAFLRRGFDGAR